MKKKWELTQEAFDALLKWLDENRERAAGRYEAIRLALIKIFICGGFSAAEELADETINRVAAKIHELARDYHGDPALYFYAIAKNVRREQGRKSRTLAELDDEAGASDPATTVMDADEDARYECLEKCLEYLSASDRRLVIEYYQQDKRAKIDHRRQLALQLGIAINALRIRAHRIRRGLEECVRNCVSQQPAN
jgi:DNA-directed RNA polymerase specialized sigma24 family protein